MAAAENDWAAALGPYARRLDEKPDDLSTLCNRAFCYVRLERFDEARADAERCIALDDAFARGYTRLAQALERSDAPKALEACRKALDLDADDAAAAKLLAKLDGALAAGLRVRKLLAETAEDRRDSVRAQLRAGAGETFAKKWAKVSTDARKTLVVSMLARAFNEVKAAYVDGYGAKEGVMNEEVTEEDPAVPEIMPEHISAELVAVNSVLAQDLFQPDVLADAPCRRVSAGPPATRDPSKDDDDDDGDDLEPPMLQLVRKAAAGRDVPEGLQQLMEAYRFEPFASHPRAADFSLGLVEAQRATLVLVTAHMLLGGDGLPTLSLASKTGEEEAFASDSEDDAQSNAAAARPSTLKPRGRGADADLDDDMVQAVTPGGSKEPSPDGRDDDEAFVAMDESRALEASKEAWGKENARPQTGSNEEELENPDAVSESDDDDGSDDDAMLAASAEELAEYRKWAAMEDEAAAAAAPMDLDDEAYSDDASEDSRRPIGPPRKDAAAPGPTAAWGE